MTTRSNAPQGISRRTFLKAGATLSAAAPLWSISRSAMAAPEFSYKLATGQDPTHPVNIRAQEAINRIREFSAVWLGLISVVALAGFAFRQSRAERPIIAIDVLKLPGFALLNLVSMLANLAAFSVWLLVAYLLARIPDMHLVAEPEVLRSNFIGGVKHMAVEFTPGARVGS